MSSSERWGQPKLWNLSLTPGPTPLPHIFQNLYSWVMPPFSFPVNELGAMTLIHFFCSAIELSLRFWTVSPFCTCQKYTCPLRPNPDITSLVKHFPKYLNEPVASQHILCSFQHFSLALHWPLALACGFSSCLADRCPLYFTQKNYSNFFFCVWVYNPNTHKINFIKLFLLCFYLTCYILTTLYWFFNLQK